MDVVWQVSREAEGRCCSALACDSVWAGGGGRTARGEARLRATRSRLLPEAFLVSALKVVNPRTPLSPAITRMVGPPTASNPPNLLVVGAPCALWTGVPGDSPKVTRERASDHQFSPSPAFLRWSHEAGHLALQWPWPRPFPGTECGEAAEGGSRAGAWPPWGSEGSRPRGPERGKAQFLPLRSGRSG